MAKKSTTSTPRSTEAKPQRTASTAPNARAAKAATLAPSAIGEPAAPNGKPKPARPSKEKAAPFRQAGQPGQPGLETISRESIALRAYFIAERRRAQGDCRGPEADWLEAEREIAMEIRRPRKPKA